MHDKTIIASHYVLNDILLTLDTGELDDINRVCEKYVSRYDNDGQIPDDAEHPEIPSPRPAWPQAPRWAKKILWT